MEKVRTTPQAETGRDELLRKTLEHTKREAIEQAAKEGRKVSDIKALQRESLQKLIHGNAKGSDGAAAGGEDLHVSEDLAVEAEQGIDKQHDQRMKAIGAAPDAHVFKRTDGTVGRQYDGSKKIELADEVLDDPESAERVAKHEAEHRLQEDGNQQAELPETGDPEIDQMRTVSRIAMRENGAVKAEGGLKDHTPEYHEYVGTSNRIAKYLNSNGQSGDQLVEEAGRTKQGFEKMTTAIQLAALQHQMNERMKQQATALAA